MVVPLNRRSFLSWIKKAAVATGIAVGANKSALAEDIGDNPKNLPIPIFAKHISKRTYGDEEKKHYANDYIANFNELAKLSKVIDKWESDNVICENREVRVWLPRQHQQLIKGNAVFGEVTLSFSYYFDKDKPMRKPRTHWMDFMANSSSIQSPINIYPTFNSLESLLAFDANAS